MIFKCPGQDSRKIKPELIKCGFCGYGVEIFSDELSRICPGCRKKVLRKQLPSCIDWCKSAKECVGEEKWKQLKGG